MLLDDLYTELLTASSPRNCLKKVIVEVEDGEGGSSSLMTAFPSTQFHLQESIIWREYCNCILRSWPKHPAVIFQVTERKWFSIIYIYSLYYINTH